ncbi:signal peptide protein [Streptomyces sp. S.PNR 29]|uniref:signal peptide protein n=1 Tax=Streptomyces sp. S.PNR 29 TaxID=2973805 RepID=UPI0025AF00C2|nr:signal peptide protein [Streptomyces sp. S.PNR 29]MDN0200504.1 signal peptide protein [Streptomyces sp. S.PNR 29]
MQSKNRRLRVASLALAVALTGLSTAGTAVAATHQAAGAQSTGARGQAPALPVGFVDLPTSPLPSDSRQHEFTATYRNTSSADRTVAPQLLVESPDAGPFLKQSDIQVERRTATGHWTRTELGSQSGTLYTGLSTAQRTVHPGATLTEHYRLTVTDPDAEGTVQPRVALLD